MPWGAKTGHTGLRYLETVLIVVTLSPFPGVCPKEIIQKPEKSCVISSHLAVFTNRTGNNTMGQPQGNVSVGWKSMPQLMTWPQRKASWIAQAHLCLNVDYSNEQLSMVSANCWKPGQKPGANTYMINNYIKYEVISISKNHCDSLPWEGQFQLALFWFSIAVLWLKCWYKPYRAQNLVYHCILYALTQVFLCLHYLHLSTHTGSHTVLRDEVWTMCCWNVDHQWKLWRSQSHITDLTRLGHCIWLLMC